MIVAEKNLLIKTSKWYLDGKVLNIGTSTDILDVRFSDNVQFFLANTLLTESLLVEEMCIAYRAWACLIPACAPKLKVTYGILWGNLVPMMLYGAEAVSLTPANDRELSSAQDSHVKRCLGLSKTSHHVALSRAAGIQSI